MQERADPNDSNRVAPDPTEAPDQSDKRQPNDAAQQQKDASQAKMDPSQAEKIAEQVDKERLELLLQELQNKIEQNPELQKFKDQILLEITQDGLRIQIVDAENRPMFDSGSPRLKSYFEDILLAMADTIRQVPNKISISGHTDAARYAGKGDFSNWELSAGRANAARRGADRRWLSGRAGGADRRLCLFGSLRSRTSAQSGQPPHRHHRADQEGPAGHRGPRRWQPGTQARGRAPPAASRSGVSSGGVSATGNLAQPINNAAFKNQVNAFDAGVIQSKP